MVSANNTLAATKNRSIQSIKEAISAGQYRFAENYAKEGLIKIKALRQYAPLEWHFMGAVQSNKARVIAENFDWVHSVSSIDMAQRLHHYAASRSTPLNLCIQINIDREPQKHGACVEDVLHLAKIFR